MNHQNITDEYAGEDCLLYTLDGTKKAVVCGRKQPHASIKAIDGSGYSIEVNWPTVERKMQGDKTFYAC